MSAPEVTAVERAEKALKGRSIYDTNTTLTRKILASALDVEEMARAADPKAFEDHPIERRSHAAALQWAVRRKIATDHAQAIRAAILGEA